MSANYRPERDPRTRMLDELRAARECGASGEQQLDILRKWAPFLDDEDESGVESEEESGEASGGPATGGSPAPGLLA